MSDDSKLPDKPSDLIELALADLEKIEQDGRYEVDMSEAFHEPIGGVCIVCFAGCVIAGTIGRSPGDEVYPRECGKSDNRKLYALDSFRCGHIAAALQWLGINHRDLDLPEEFGVTSYEDDPDDFKDDMRKLSDMLRVHGL